MMHGQTCVYCQAFVFIPGTRPTWKLDIGYWTLDIPAMPDIDAQKTGQSEKSPKLPLGPVNKLMLNTLDFHFQQ